MTKRWRVPQLWPGQTAAVLATGPSLTMELAHSVAGMPRVAVKRAFKLAPDADMLVAIDCDYDFWMEAESFRGMKICGVECELDLLYLPMRHERVESVEFRNNMLFAIRIAAAAGAKKILVLGCDTERYDRIASFGNLLTKGYVALVAELASAGVEVCRCA